MNTIDRAVSLSILKNNFFLIGVFLGSVAATYFLIYGHFAEGWLSVKQYLILSLFYTFFCFSLASFGARKKPSNTKLWVQILIINTGVGIAVVHDPVATMPLVFLLAVLPVEYGIRYGKQALQHALVGAFIITILIIIFRYSLMTPGVTEEALYTLALFWALMVYLYLTVIAQIHLQEETIIN